ncbi:MAG: hypothetical protein NC235_15495 [Clostridiales bacterium]|nr:hypothetical protein [Clostridiales bacterium]
MQEKNLREVLEKCSKAELVEVAVELSKYQLSTFRSPVEIVMIKRIDTIDKKIDENFAQSKILREKFNAIPECERNISNDDVRNLAIAINNNTAEYLRLSKRRDKLEKELYK